MINQLMKSQIIINLLFIAVLLILSNVILKFIHKLINKYFKENEKKNPVNAAKLETVSKAIYSVVRFVIIFIVIIILLDMLGINTRSIIATAGIGGIAIAFGAQTIIQDFIKGMFMILDDMIRVGDFVECAGISGTVESVGLRITRIRDYDGSLHTVPNSQIQNIKNYNRGPQKSEIIFSVSYDTSLEEIKEIIEEMSEKITKEEAFEKIFVEKPRFLEINELDNLSYKIRVTSIVKEDSQYAVKRRMREIIKEELEKRKIKASVLEK